MNVFFRRPNVELSGGEAVRFNVLLERGGGRVAHEPEKNTALDARFF